MEIRVTTCPVCGNRYCWDDYPECPACAKSMKKQGGTENMSDKANNTITTETTPLGDTGTLQGSDAQTENGFGKTVSPDYATPFLKTISPYPIRDECKPEPTGNPSSIIPQTTPVIRSEPTSMPVLSTSPSVPRSERVQPLDPVVGWLVALNGENSGNTYEIRGYRTQIGRGDGRKIKIALNDSAVSMGVNCSISYDSDSQKFGVTASDNASNPVRLNNKILRAGHETDLDAYDRIQIGNTKLLFLPLCGSRFHWGEEA